MNTTKQSILVQGTEPRESQIFQLYFFPILKATSFIIMRTSYQSKASISF